MEADASMSRLNMFMNMIGIKCLENILCFTNIELYKLGKKATTRQEILNFIWRMHSC
jgi:hypothetical protein